MTAAKIAITLEETLLDQLDRLVQQRVFKNRSQAIQTAVRERLDRHSHARLAIECAKLDTVQERSMAEEGLAEDFKEWPAY